MYLFKYSLLIFSIFLASGCGIQGQKQELQQKLVALREKGQELALKERELEIKEQILNERQKKMDSVMIQSDTLSDLYPNVPGRWLVKMICSETTCSGSALGDTKVEQWAISFQNNLVVAKAMNNKYQLTRIYTGHISTGGQINLIAQIPGDSLTDNPSTKITIQLKQNGNSSMIGQREIIHPKNCHIIYSLNLNKQN